MQTMYCFKRTIIGLKVVLIVHLVKVIEGFKRTIIELKGLS